jgi:ketosteroid isomerase-like protein
MSRENVEFAEALVSASSELDQQALLAALPEVIAQTCTPDVEWAEDPKRADGRIERGHEAVRRSWERWLEQWDDYSFEAERFIDCGDDVLIAFREHGRGATSGASVGARNFAVMTMRDGKIARYREFYDEHAALEAVGLPPHAMTDAPPGG